METPAEHTPLPIESPASVTPPDGDFVTGLTAKLAAAFGEETAPTPPVVAPTEEAKPVEKKSPDDIIKEADEGVEKGTKMPRAEAWNAVKAKAAAAEERAKAVQAELEALKSKPPVDEATKAELETLRQKLAEKEERIKAFDVEASDEFQELVNIPARRAYEDIKNLAGRNALKAEELWEAMVETDVKKRNAALSDITANLNSVEAAELFTLTRELQQLSATRESLRANSAKAFEELEARKVQQAAATKQKNLEDWAKGTDEVWGAVAAKIPDLPESIKNQVRSVDAAAIAPRNQVYNAIAGLALPELSKRQVATSKELAEVKSALAKLQKASPSTETASSPASQTPPSEGGFLDAVLQGIAQRG